MYSSSEKSGFLQDPVSALKPFQILVMSGRLSQGKELSVCFFSPHLFSLEAALRTTMTALVGDWSPACMSMCSFVEKHSLPGRNRV
ncbi:MAG TPA: hypothetical protein DCE42_07835 [Myxococcales bacterium]|nr:hypothetical protein [Deltaproteobacteria bacterium]HAA54653.1 hypothetical protein [Myxococcales bacterium]